MKNKKKFIIFTLVTVVFIVAAITTALIPKTKVYKSKASVVGGITLSLSPTKNLRVNQSQRISITADTGNKDIDSFSIILLYDSTKLDSSDIQISAPFEQLENKIDVVSASQKKITIAGILPPGNISPTVTGPFILGSFLVKGMAQTDVSNITFATDDSRFQIAKGGNILSVVSANSLKMCVQSSASSCPSMICDKPDPAIIKYPLAAPKITADSKVVAYFEIPNDGCSSKQYRVSIFDGAGERCSTDWLSSTTSGVKIENTSFKNGSKCGPLSSDGNYTLKVNIRSGGESGIASDLATREFKYDSQASVPEDFPSGFGTYGGTDVGVSFSFSRNGRDNTFVENYVKTGLYPASWSLDMALIPHGADSDQLDYTAKKAKEIVVNFKKGVNNYNGNDVHSIGIDDAYSHLPLSDAYTLPMFKEAAVGPNGRLGMTLYASNYSLSNEKDSANLKLAIYYYNSYKWNDYTAGFTAVRDHWKKVLGLGDGDYPGSNKLIMYAGLYPKTMRGFHNQVTWSSENTSNNMPNPITNLSEEITNNCKNTKAAIALKNNGQVRGIELFDQSPTNCSTISPTPFPTPLIGSDGKEEYRYTSEICYVDKIIADMTTVILNGGGTGDTYCTDINKYCQAYFGKNCPTRSH